MMYRNDARTFDMMALRLATKLAGAVILVTLALLILAALQTRAFAAASIAPRPQITVQSDDIHLSDVFDGAPEKDANAVLAPAPKAGEEMVWNAATLQKIAGHFNLAWKASAKDEIHIKRAGTIVAVETIKDMVVNGLREQGMDGRFDITFGNLSEQGWNVAASDKDTPKVERLSVDRAAGTFHAVLRAGRESMVSDGKIIPIVAVPTLRRTMTQGDLIGDGDIVFVDMKLADVKPNTLMKLEDLVGYTPRKPMAVGAVIKQNDIESPRLIKRGDRVALVFKNDHMMLMAQGKALDDGVRGGRVRAVNNASNRTVEGTVDATGQVVISE